MLDHDLLAVDAPLLRYDIFYTVSALSLGFSFWTDMSYTAICLLKPEPDLLPSCMFKSQARAEPESDPLGKHVTR